MGTLRTEPIEPDVRKGEHVVYPVNEPWGSGPHDARFRADRSGATRVLTASARVGLIAGLSAGAVCIVGLAEVQQAWMGAVAAIVLGSALMARAATVSIGLRRVARRDRAAHLREAHAGVALELLAGIIGVLAGVIAPATEHPAMLVGIAAIIFGVALLLGSSEQTTLGELGPPTDGAPTPEVTRELVQTSTVAMVLVGVGAAVLGVLATLQDDLPLSLVALLFVGVVLAFAGGALGARMIRRLA